jgi:hypothetical protein
MNGDLDPIGDLDPCPSDESLALYAEGRVKDPLIAGAVEAHAKFCASCRRKLSELRLAAVNTEELIESLAHRLKERQDTLAELSARGNVPGSIWRTFPQAEDDLYGPMVVILEKLDHLPRGLVRVAEVSEAIDQAIDTDLLLSPHESGLSFPCMVRSEKVFHTDFGKLKTFAGQLPPMLVSRIDSFCDSLGNFDRNVPLSQYVFYKNAQGITFMQRRGVTSGLPVTTDDDPRMASLESAWSNCDHLYLLERQYFEAAELDLDDAGEGFFSLDGPPEEPGEEDE